MKRNLLVHGADYDGGDRGHGGDDIHQTRPLASRAGQQQAVRPAGRIPRYRWSAIEGRLLERRDLDPNVAEVHYELAYALAQIPGRVPEAIGECQKMLDLKPGDEPGRQLMASLLAFQNGTQR